MKASSQPETSAGAMIGMGHVEEHPHGRRSEVHRRLLEAEIEVGQAGLHHHSDVGHAEGECAMMMVGCRVRKASRSAIHRDEQQQHDSR